MNRLSLLFLLLISLTACEPGSTDPTQATDDLLEIIDPETKDLPDLDEKWVFEGTIDKYPILMELHRKGDSLDGQYRYLNQDEYLGLKGTVDSDEKITLLEYTKDGKHSGTFRGYTGFRDRFVGDWVKSNNQDALLFNLNMTENFWYRPSPFVKSEQLVVKRISKVRVAPDSSCHMEIDYPVLEGLDPEITERINARLAGPADSVLDRQIWECADEEVAQNEQLPPTSIQESYEVHGIRGPVLSISQHNYEYSSGAAHGNFGSITLNFDLRTGQVLTPEDLFLADYDTLMNELIRRELKMKFPEDHGIFSFEAVAPEQNYIFESDSFATYFNPYAIGPYAAGQIMLKFGYDELAPIMQADL